MLSLFQHVSRDTPARKPRLYNHVLGIDFRNSTEDLDTITCIEKLNTRTNTNATLGLLSQLCTGKLDGVGYFIEFLIGEVTRDNGASNIGESHLESFNQFQYKYCMPKPIYCQEFICCVKTTLEFATRIGCGRDTCSGSFKAKCLCIFLNGIRMHIYCKSSFESWIIFLLGTGNVS